jgi:hypothetical protein
MNDVKGGLYAAGMDTACNIYHDLYVNYLPGNVFGWALKSGRMAAENAVEYNKRDRRNNANLKPR